MATQTLPAPGAAPAGKSALAAAPASEGLVTFSVMWGLAMMLSLVSKLNSITGVNGTALAIVNWVILAVAVSVVVDPRKTWRLGLLALLMCGHYLARLPTASNNQWITFFMNATLVCVIGLAMLRNRGTQETRDDIYEQSRVVARALLAVMYFYGIFHKINTDFLDPDVSCAVALYKPLTQLFGFEDSLFGRYGAIAATFIVETITMVALYWRRYFAVGLILALAFHYIIPVSGFSWYMDFSSLVLALYMLSVPREVSGALHGISIAFLRSLPFGRAGVNAVIALFAVLLIGAAITYANADGAAERPAQLMWHSAWIIVWVVVGGTAMVILTRAALTMLPYEATPNPAQPLWLYAFPLALFVSSFSPYIGLKTESSIAMFSNLHTEGGQTNHLLFSKPPYLFGYQKDVARLVDSSDPVLKERIGQHLVMFEIGRRLNANPEAWVTYELNGRLYRQVGLKNFPGPIGTPLEYRFLLFKTVDFERPKVCTH
jgi:hypothetical protein